MYTHRQEPNHLLEGSVGQELVSMPLFPGRQSPGALSSCYFQGALFAPRLFCGVKTRAAEGPVEPFRMLEFASEYERIMALKKDAVLLTIT